MTVIRVNNIRLYAFHGCLPEEEKIGGHYRVDVKIEAEVSSAIQMDNLSDTVDYCMVYEIVKREMAIRSRLIEHVAGRIAKTLVHELHEIRKVRVSVTKLAPPVNGDVGEVRVDVTEKR